MTPDLKHLRTIAESWLGTPFRSDCLRRGAHGGVDCKWLAAGVVCEWLDLRRVPELHKSAARFADDGVVLRGLEAFFCQGQYGGGHWYQRGELPIAGGDLLGFRRNHVGHVVVALDAQTCLHATRRTGVAIERISEIARRMELAHIFHLAKDWRTCFMRQGGADV